MENVKDKLCLCGKTPYFGYPGDKIPYYCSQCKLDNMINIKDKK